MRDQVVVSQDLSVIGALVGDRMNRIRARVYIVDAERIQIQRQTVRPGLLCGHVVDNPTIFAAHRCGLDSRMQHLPVGPKEDPKTKKRRYSRTIIIVRL